MRKLIFLCYIVSTCVFAKPQVLKFSQEDLTEDRKIKLCELFPEDCINSNIWALKRIEGNEYYFISQEKIYFLQEQNNNFRIINHWDFLNYIPKESRPNWFGNGKVLGVSVNNALYPIDKNNFAIGVRYGWGDNLQIEGLVQENKMDFVKLEKDGRYTSLIDNVPYYYFLMTWHCLDGELDSDPKAKCIENEEFNLDVKYLEPKKWEMTMKFERDPSPFSKHKAFQVHQSFIVNLNNSNEIRVPEEWLKY